MANLIDPLEISIEDILRDIQEKGDKVENLKKQLADIKAQFNEKNTTRKLYHFHARVNV
jgi:CCR4-NOT transcriptional regulation complex NOT5 subunit